MKMKPEYVLIGIMLVGLGIFTGATLEQHLAGRHCATEFSG